jgi:hypothetical protein
MIVGTEEHITHMCTSIFSLRRDANLHREGQDYNSGI